jgi:hypothetical protein
MGRVCIETICEEGVQYWWRRPAMKRVPSLDNQYCRPSTSCDKGSPLIVDSGWLETR